jgi:methionyl-tRNA formyltransferase
MRLAFFGSGEFGLPTLARLVECHDVALVVTQPDRPAGRNRHVSPTPIAAFAASHGLPTLKPHAASDAQLHAALAAARCDAIVVIAYGHKLPPGLLAGTVAINLHASLLPKFRGAAPINWAMIKGESQTGVSVIEVADRMDAGAILAQAATPIDPLETAGELHDRLAAMGPALVLEVLQRLSSGTVERIVQEEQLATKAPRLSRADATISFDQPARAVRCRVHGLTPWPGCFVRHGGRELKLVRVRERDAVSAAPPGAVLEDHSIACATGRLELLEVQPPGGRVMSFDDYRRGHPLPAEARCEPR